MTSRLLLVAFAAASLGASAPEHATAQAPKLDGSSLTWMAGARVHTTETGAKVYEAFLGPANGMVTGTATVAIGKERAYQEFHRIGPNASGVYGLAVASTRSGFTWNFTPLKAIEAGKVTFQSEDGALTISYFKEPQGGVGSRVDRVVDGKTITQEWHFKAAPAPN
jgi:hypothetical protein